MHDQIGELLADALDLSARLLALALVHLPLVDPLAGPPQNRRDDLQITQQLRAGRTSRRRFLQLTPGLQKQLRLLEQALS
ncbi:MAG: hypothetical protein ACXW5U_03940 [Thermoanaerobaculia bacterium]